MVSRVNERDYDVILRFGGGVHSRPQSIDIGETECTSGENFELDFSNNGMRARQPFDLKDTAPNAEPIRGFAQLQKHDGKIFTLIQAGSDVYSWDGSSFTNLFTVNPNSRLRGPLEANWTLGDIVLIGDLSLNVPVLEFNGQTVQPVDTGLPGDMFAKYVSVSRERAWYANVKAGRYTPHLLVGSGLENYRQVSTTDRPPSGPGTVEGSFFGEGLVSLGAADPFYLPTPDGKPINGLVHAFRQDVVMSSQDGRIWVLTGNDARDFSIEPLFQGSFASGDEPIVFTGSDVLYGREGRIESLVGSLNFGDVEADDPSRFIKPDVQNVKRWDVNFDQRHNRVYFWPDNEPHVWVMHRAVREQSPWSKWTTQHSSALQKTASMTMFDPTTGLRTLFWGDDSGNIYAFDGESDGDAGSASIKTKRVSKAFDMPLDTRVNYIDGYVRFKRLGWPVSFTITLYHGGERVFRTVASSIDIEAPGDAFYFNDTAYFNDSAYFNTIYRGQLSRRGFSAEGGGNEFQITVEADTTQRFEITEVGLRFQASS